MLMSRSLTRNLLFALTICAGTLAWGAEPAAEKEKVTYNDHVLPLLKAKCGSCHNANDRKGGLTLDNYAAAMTGGSSGAVLEGGDPSGSYLWSLVNHDSEPKMPPNQPKLPEAELAVIKNWIEGGLLEAVGGKAKIKKTSSVAKIEVSGARPTVVAIPEVYFGEPKITSPRANAVTAMATSPWAPIVAISGHRQIAIYHTQTLELLGVLAFPEGQPQILKFSRNGSLLMAGGGRGGAAGKVVVFDVKTGQRMVEVGDEYDAVMAADISADHSQIALGGPKKMLRVYSTATGELQFEMKKHTDWITAIEFSPDGVLLASGDRANGLFIWESVSGKEFQNLQGHQAIITDVSWRPDSNVVASASEDNTIRLWDANEGREIKKWNAHGGCTAIEYTRDGRIVSTGRDRVVRLWNGDGGQLREFPGLTEIGLEIAFDSESERVLAGDWNGLVKVWNATDGKDLGQISTNPPVLTARIPAAEQVFAAAQQQETAVIAQLAAAEGVVAAKKKLAEDAQAASATAAQVVTQQTTSKQAAEKQVADLTAALVVAETAAKTSQTTLEQATATQKTAAAGTDPAVLKAADEALVVAQTAFTAAGTARDQATVKVTEAKVAFEKAVAAEKAAVDDAAVKKAAADKAVLEAPATPEQQKAIQTAQEATAAAKANTVAQQKRLEQLRAWQQQLATK